MLTPAQITALGAAIVADPTMNAFPNTADGAFALAAYLNQPVTPAFYVWRTAVTTNEIMRNGFDWTRVDNATTGKARIWEWMVQAGTLDPSQANVRAGILAAWPAASADLAMRRAIFAHCQRPATRAERLFATGTGTTVTEQGVGPAVMDFEGNISFQDVLTARGA